VKWYAVRWSETRSREEGEKRNECNMCGIKKNNKQETIHSAFLTGCCLPYCTCLISRLVYIYVSFKVLVCIFVSWIVCRVIAVSSILWSPCVCSLSVYLWCGVFVGLGICCTVSIDVFPLDAGLLAGGQYSEGPATGHLDTGFFFGFPVLSWFPRLQVATTCFSCSPPNVNLVANQTHVLCMCDHCHWVTTQLQLWVQENLSKHWSLCTNLYDVKFQKTDICPLNINLQTQLHFLIIECACI
jgi:hypothetical protein